ncbi:MAG: 3-phenylpropionate/trans-cinnamate dioxygenase ferredoxin reductase component [Frankiaceae bacterium]|nr:3-phenylpropionate/trans-cinnamate dioxygenase ferredoxin reductase component [Frankiaceae bacterium]
MTDSRTFVVAGAGLAGAKAVEQLRTDGFDGRIVLLGEEPHAPYERPDLSKGFLLGKTERQKLFVHGDDFYATHDVDLRTDVAVTAIDRAARTVTIDGTDTIPYDALLLATGAAPRPLSIPGAELDGVRYLRTLDDAEALRRAIDTATAVAIIGGGWIGMEVAAAARSLGRNVTVVFPESEPLERVLGIEAGATYAELHRAHGVRLLPRAEVESFEGTGSVEAVRLGDGGRIEADLVVVGIGVLPRTSLATNAGLAVSDGIEVDEYLRTSDPAVYAAGDIAGAWHPVLRTRLRVEHWANALHQGPAAARSMLGLTEPFDRLPYFYSDQFERGMEYVGHAPSYDRVVFRGDPGSGEFCVYWLLDGCIAAAMNVNVWDVVDVHKRLIAAGAAVDTTRLADPATPLESLVARA